MLHRPLIALDLRKLFCTIARTTVASGWLTACADDPSKKDTNASQELIQDAASGTQVEMDSVRRSADAGASPTPDEPDVAAPIGTTMTTWPISPTVEDAGASRDVGVSPDNDGAVTVPNEAFERVPCPESTALPPGELRTPTAVLGVVVYSQEAVDPQAVSLSGGQQSPLVAEIARADSSCARRADVASCDRELKLLASQPCAQLPCQIAIAVHADKLIRVEEREELIRRFGNIDSAAEAVLLAAFDGYPVCPGAPAGSRNDPMDIGAEVRALPSGYELRIARDICGAPLSRRLLSVDASGKVLLLSTEELRPARCAVGRRPPGLCEKQETQAATETGRFLAELAYLEHASIYSFYRLFHELREHGADEALREMAFDAMLDEVQHAREMGSLAEAFGAQVVHAQVKETAWRSLFEIGLDNASEGCVRETFGALLATYQAVSAEDERVRNVMARIAEEETRHATLSWKLMAWLRPLLSTREQRRVDQARAEACAELALELETALPESVRRTLGIPGPEVASLLLRQMTLALSI